MNKLLNIHFVTFLPLLKGGAFLHNHDHDYENHDDCRACRVYSTSSFILNFKTGIHLFFPGITHIFHNIPSDLFCHDFFFSPYLRAPPQAS